MSGTPPPVPLSTAERRALRLALELAIQWEASLIDANSPDRTDGMRQTIRRCQRNIRAFRALLLKL